MKIRLTHPDLGELTVPVGGDQALVIGRTDGDLNLSWDPRISRRHGRLWARGEQIWFEDLGSKNGSWRGKERVFGPIPLVKGTQVILGDTVLERLYESQHATEVDTLELELQASSKPTAVAVAPVKQRQHPRFLSPGRILVNFENRSAFSEAWLRDISKGGLFIESEHPPPVGTRLEVVLEVPDSALTLTGIVVHVASAGFGVQFADLSAAKRQQLERYVEGLAKLDAQNLQTQYSQQQISQQQISQQQISQQQISQQQISQPQSYHAPDSNLEEVRAVLNHAEHNQVYQALGLTPQAQDRDLIGKIDALERRFRGFVNLSPPQRARLELALGALERFRRIMSSPEARLEYDFRSGHLRLEERLAQAANRTGPNMELLRLAWARVFPDKIDQANVLVRQALAARQQRDLKAALELGRRALLANPFHEELKKTVDAWASMVPSAQGSKR